MIFATLLTAQAQSCLIDPQCPNDEFCARYTSANGGSAGQCVPETGEHIENEFSEECLRPAGGSMNSNTDIIMADCRDSSSRRWHQIPYNNGTVGLMNENSRLCIQVTGSGSNAGYEQRPCVNTYSQNYVLVDESNGSVRLHQGFFGPTCVRAVPSVDDPFQSHTCDQFANRPSRHWFLY